MSAPSSTHVLLVKHADETEQCLRALLAAVPGAPYTLESVCLADARERLRQESCSVCIVDEAVGPREALALLEWSVHAALTTPLLLLAETESHEADLRAMRAGAQDYLVRERLDATLLERALRYAIERTKAVQPSDLLRSIIDSMSEGVAVTDDSGKLVTFNRAAEQILGSGVHTGEPAEWAEHFGFFLPDGVTRFPVDAYPVIRALRGEKPDDVELLVRNATHPKGAYIRVSARAYTEGESGVRGAVAVFRDVTQAREREETLKRTQEQLFHSQKLESIGKLAGGVAHDFNNLLASILGYAHVLKRDFGRNPAIERKTGSIIRSAERGAQLTRQLLGFARLAQYRKEAIDLPAIIEEVRAVLSRSIEKTIALRTLVSFPVSRVEGDPTQLFQVLLNLAINARDAMPEGGQIRFELADEEIDEAMAQRLELESSGPYVRLQVIDTGHGIPEPVQSKIFEPFFTTKEPGRGTGLGLSMAYGIMKSHRGAVDFSTSAGQGTAFSLYFPVLTPAAAAATIAKAVPTLDRGWFRGKGILIADDEEQLRELVRDYLEPLGARLFFAENGRRALELYRVHRQEIDCIVLDVGMPQMNGIVAFKELRKENPDVRIVFSTGYADNEEVSRLLKTGNVDYVEKPYSEADLLGKVSSALPPSGSA